MSLLGDRLRLAREARGVAPLQVEIDTRIRATVINALEQGDYESLPPEPFLRGLIRTYAMYLGLDAEDMIRLYIADFAPPPPPPTEPIARPIAPAPQPVQPVMPPPTAPVVPPANTPGLSLFARLNGSDTPPPPPEEFSERPPEMMPEEPAKPAPMPTAQMIFSRRLPSIAPLRLPMPVIIAIGVAVAVMLLVCVAFIFTQGLPALSAMINPPQTATPTRAPATRTPLPAGGAPTGVPTFAATAPPFTALPGAQQSPTARVTPRRTIEPAQTGLDLTIEAVEKVTVHIGLDGVLVFEDTLEAGTTRSWSAKESLYIRLENAKGAALIFNGKSQAARTFAERTTMERQWTLNPKGTPVSVPPIEPPAIAPTAPTRTPALPVPTPTLTPTA